MFLKTRLITSAYWAQEYAFFTASSSVGEELKQQGILDKAGIIYRHNSIPLYSDNDSISPRSACRSHMHRQRSRMGG